MQYLYAIMLIGYARVSTGEQTTAAQVAALKTSGCELIFRDNASGGRWDRPELHQLLSQLRKGDVLVVWTLDRLSRSLRDVLTIMERVQERHAGFRSLKEAVDTTTPAGRMMMQMVGAFAEFERAMLKERTKAGLDAARKEGRIGGRPPKLKPHQRIYPLTQFYVAGMVLPFTAVEVRRLHDTNFSGWWLLTPVPLVLFFVRGTRGNNRFGPDPKAESLV